MLIFWLKVSCFDTILNLIGNENISIFKKLLFIERILLKAYSLECIPIKILIIIIYFKFLVLNNLVCIKKINSFIKFRAVKMFTF